MVKQVSPSSHTPDFKHWVKKPFVLTLLHLLVFGLILSVGSHQTDSAAMSIAMGVGAYSGQSDRAQVDKHSTVFVKKSDDITVGTVDRQPLRFTLSRHSRIPVSFSTTKSEFRFVATPGRQQFTEIPESLVRRVVAKQLLVEGATRDLSVTEPMFEFAGVGFPHIETNRRPDVEKYKPYKKLLVTIKGRDGQIDFIPNVACHGYSPSKTLAKASRYAADIDKWAEHYKVSGSLVRAVIAQESCFRNHAVSPVGARGLMQLMPETADWLGVQDQSSAKQNLRAGVKYLASLQKEFEDLDLVLAAYNAGPGNVRRYGGVPPFDETEDYVLKVKQFYQSFLWGERLADAG